MRNLLLMVQFMTRYPVPLTIDFTSDRFVAGMKWMPLVGLFIGLPAGLGYLLLEPLVGGELAACFAMIFLITVTGGLHLDGVADTADGLFSYKPRERVLAIMRESTLGTNAVIAIVLDILLKFLLIKNIPGTSGAAALCCMPVIGRMAIPWHAAFSRYARKGSGMGFFVGQLRPAQAGSTTLVSCGLVVLILSFFGSPSKEILLFLLLLHGIACITALLFARYLKIRIGGITGDTIGATIELVEIITLFLFYISWKYLS
ncbi:MAG: adenosylcobinamide-GDP ribazoletransferase [Desulfobulbus propionicus]|nr:MAG: adenosylcobinamide-GDP ribazoletransferase [Desulfobulbus propionicus]